MHDTYDYLFKIVIIGDSGVGKSNLLGVYLGRHFDRLHRSTIGVEFATKTLKWKGKQIKAQLWDTAGQERYRSITSIYYRGSIGALVCYDITKRKSFQNVGKWLTELRTQTNGDIDVLLVGNKTDFEEFREVSTYEAEAFAASEGITFVETSAIENINVEAAFELLIHKIAQLKSQPKRDQASTGIKRIRSQKITLSSETMASAKDQCC